jgi:long-subunit acyl-CoA synthetase (AMP-forming)
VLTHRNFRAMVEMLLTVEGLVEPGDRLLLHLPLAHTFRG